MKIISFFLIITFTSILAFSQEVDQDKIKATVFTIPESPAFILLGTNPTNVIRPGFTKDLKIDYILKEGKFVSDLALDMKPIWLFIVNKYSLDEYRKLKPVPRAISTLNFSVGTAEKNGVKKFAWSLSMTILRKDPMMDKSYQNSLDSILKVTKAEENFYFHIQSEISKLQRKIKELQDKPDSIKLKLELEQNLMMYQKEMDNYSNLQQKIKNDELQKLNSKYLNEHLGDPVLQIGYGNLYNYENPSLDSLKFINSGWGLWVQGSFGFDLFDLLYTNNKNKNHIVTVSGMACYKKIDSSKSQFYGINLKYGSSKANIFAEFSYDKTGTDESYTIAYGGELRIDDTKSITFGLKNIYKDKFTSKSLVPAIKLNWILAGNQF